MPLNAPVATLTSSLSHMVPRMLSLTVVASPALLNASAMACTRGVSWPSSSPMKVCLPATPARIEPGARSTPPT
ncbi:hypothetical protein D3C75_1184170 [compost metagenome]